MLHNVYSLIRENVTGINFFRKELKVRIDIFTAIQTLTSKLSPVSGYEFKVGNARTWKEEVKFHP
jgi:hypothetical protein